MAVNGAGLQSIYERLNSAAEYHPLEADTFADWSLEAGDIVTVTRDNAAYESPVHSATHVWKGQQTVRISSGGDEKRESVARMSRKKYNSGGSGVRSGRMLGNRITMAYDGLSAEIVQTESEMSTRMTDMYNGLESYVVQTASHWSSELGNAYQGLSSKVEQTASTWNVALNDTYQGLSSRITATDGKVEAEAAARQSDVTEIKGRLILEAGKAGLVAEVTDNRQVYYLPDRSVFPTVGEANKIYLDVSTETYYEYKNGTYVVTTPGQTIKAGNITTAINEAGESEAHIDANKVYIGNSKSTTVISGKVDAADLTTDWFAANIANINLMNVKSIATSDADGTASFSSYYGNHYYLHFPGGGGSVVNEDMRTGIKDVQIAGPTNNVYTLQYKRYGDSAWRDADVSFSRATSLSGAWSGSRFTVSASPQGATISRDITHSAPYKDENDRWKVEVYATVPGTGTPPTEEHFGHNINIYNYLQDKTGTNKITANGTYTPTGSAIGFSEVQVDVQTGTTLSGTWSSAHLEVTASPQNEKLHRYIYSGDIEDTSSDGNSWYVPILSKNDPNASSSERTGHRVLVNATGRYNAGWGAARDKVDFPSGSGSASSITVYGPASTVGNTDSRTYSLANNGNNAVKLYTTVGSMDVTVANYTHGKYDAGWGAAEDKVSFPTGSGSSSSITVSGPSSTVGGTASRSYTLANNGNNAVKLYTTVGSIDVTVANYTHGKYDAGVTAGKNAVTISKGNWSSGQVSFSKSEGTASSSGVRVSLGGSWSGNSYNYTIYDSWSGSAVSTGYTGSVDATARYNAGYSDGNTAGYNSGYSVGYTAGQSAGYSSGVTDGRNSVSIVKGNWGGGAIGFEKSLGSSSYTAVNLSLEGSWRQDGAVCKYGYTVYDNYGNKVSTGLAGSITANPWINPADSEVNHQGYLAYDTLYGITLAGYTLATWRTQAKGGGGGGDSYSSRGSFKCTGKNTSGGLTTYTFTNQDTNTSKWEVNKSYTLYVKV